MPDARIVSLTAVPAVVGGLVVTLLSALLGLPVLWAIVIGVVVAALLAVVAYRASATRVIGALHAEPLVAGAEPQLDSLLDALCVNNGYDRPDVRRIDSAARNSAVVSAGGTTTLVLTDGLIGALDYMGLEALLAHQLAASGQPDLEYRTRMLGLLSLLPASLQQRLGEGLMSPPDVFGSDVEAAQLTRYPPGQVALLDVLDDGDNRVGGVSVPAAALWLVNPLGVDVDTAPHPALEDRQALLREL